MTNEQLAEYIQLGGSNELIPILWERVKKLLYMKSDNVYRAYREQCDRCGVTSWDIKQACYEAFLKAIDGYKAEQGYKFTAYLKYPFKTAFSVLIGTRYSKRDPLNECASLDKPISNADGEDIFLKDVIPDTSVNLEEDVVEEQAETYLSAVLWGEVDKLPEQKRNVIYSRFKHNMTLKQTGESMGITPEAVRNIEAAALRKLRYNPVLRRNRDIIGYDDFRVTSCSLSYFQRTGHSSVETVALNRVGFQIAEPAPSEE